MRRSLMFAEKREHSAGLLVMDKSCILDNILQGPYNNE